MYAVPLVFVLLVVWMLIDPWGDISLIAPARQVPAEMTDTAPVRQPLLQPEARIAGYMMQCSECHDLFPSPAETFRTLTQHRHIQLNHGLNTRCFNCHHPTDRDAFVDDFGEPIPYDQPQLLCSKCHGPVYNDWRNGSHGRTNGFWNTSMGSRERSRCVECHDPHAPAFQPMRPAPPPNTLRMGDPSRAAHEDERVQNPLLIYRRLHSGGEPNSSDREGTH